MCAGINKALDKKELHLSEKKDMVRSCIKKSLTPQLLCGTALICLSFAGSVQFAYAQASSGVTISQDTNNYGGQTPGPEEVIIGGNGTLGITSSNNYGLTQSPSVTVRQTGNVATTVTTNIGTTADLQKSVDAGKSSGYSQLVQPDPEWSNATPAGTISIESGTVHVIGPNQDKSNQGSVATNGVIVIGRGDNRYNYPSNTNPDGDTTASASITDGGTVSAKPFTDKDGNIYSTISVGYGPGATGTVSVTGKNSSVTDTDGKSGGVITVGDDGGTGTLNVGDKDGGTVVGGILNIGGLTPAGTPSTNGFGISTGTVNVNGNGKIVVGVSATDKTSSLDEGIQLGGEGSATLNIGDGTGNATIVDNGGFLLGNVNSNGTTSSGIGVKAQNIIQNINSGVGGDGNGSATLNINKGGTLSVGDVVGTVTVTASNGSKQTQSITEDGLTTSKTPYSVTLAGGTLKNRDSGGTLTDQANMTFTSKNGNSTIDTNGGLVALQGDLSGDGGVNFTGSKGGAVSITGNNTYKGTTNIDSGTTIGYQDSGDPKNPSANSDGTLTKSASIVDNGNIVINHSDNVIIPSNISGTGSLEQDGAGRTTLTGQDTYTGDTTVNHGQLMVGDGGALTNSNVHINNDATFGVNQSGNTTLSQKIDGTGQFLKEGTGTTTLSGVDTYTGDTTVNGGTLALGDGSSNGTNSDGSVSKSTNFHLGNGTTLETNHSDNITLSSNIEGSGSFVQNGSGVVTDTGVNTFTGDTTINNGRIFYGNGTAAGTNKADGTVTESKNIYLNNNGIMNIEHSDNIAMNSTIEGSGSFVQNGTGTTTLNGSIYLNDPTSPKPEFPTDDSQVVPGGTVLVDKGTLVVDGTSGGIKDSKTGQYIKSATGGRENISTNGYIVVGREPGTSGTLVIQNGAGVEARAINHEDQNISSSILVGYDGQSTGTVTVTGQYSSLVADGSQGQIVLGNNGTATLNVENQGSVQANQIVLGNGSGADGTLNITGTNSLVIAGSSSQTNSNSGIIVGYDGNGTVNIGSGGQLVVNGQMSFGSNNIAQTGKGVVNLNQGGTLTGADVSYKKEDGSEAVAHGIVAADQSYQFNLNGGTIQVQQGGQLTSDVNMTLGAASSSSSASSNSTSQSTTSNSTISNLDMNGNGKIILQGKLSGTGGLNIDDSQVKSRNGTSTGEVILNGVDTYTGDTTVSKGTLILGDGTADGTDTTNKTHPNSISSSANFHLGNGTTLETNHSDNVTLSSNIDGSGSFVQNGSGVVTDTGVNTFTGDTTINNGRIFYGNGTAAGTNKADGTVTESKNIYLNNNGIMNIEHSDNIAMNSTIKGSGSFAQNGTGTTTLNGSIYLNDPTVRENPFPDDDSQVIPGATVLVDKGTLVVDGTSGGIKDSTTGQYLTSVTGGRENVSTNGYIVVGREAGTSGNLVVQNGAGVEARAIDNATQNISSSIVVGYSGGSTGTVTVTGQYSSFVADGSQGQIVLGENGTATLNVENQGSMQANQIILGNGSGADGTLNITGTNSLVIAGGDPTANVGTSAKSALNTNSGIVVGYDGNGTVNIGSGGQLVVNGQMVLGSQDADQVGQSVVNLNQGGTLTAADTLTKESKTGQLQNRDSIIAKDSSYQFNLNGGTIQVQQGGQLTSDVNMTLGAASSSSSSSSNSASQSTTSNSTISNLDMNGNGKIILQGKLSGTGGLNIDDSQVKSRNGISTGEVILNGVDTYTGDTTVKRGILILGDGTEDGTNKVDNSISKSNAFHLATAGVLAVDHSDDVTFSSNIDGGGQLQQVGKGITTYTGQDTATGDTYVQAGELILGNGGAITQSNIHINGQNSVFGVNQSGNTTLSQTIDGTGQFLKEGTGTTTLTGIDTYTGDTTVNSGTLSLGDGSFSGTNTTDQTISKTGAFHIGKDGTLTVNHSNNVTLGSNIDGVGQFQQNGTGRTTLTGQDTSTGDTSVNHGQLMVGDGGALTKSNVHIAKGATFGVSQSKNTTLSQKIDGAGTFLKEGTGTTTLSGVDTYTGATTVSSGTLILGDGTADGTDTSAKTKDITQSANFHLADGTVLETDHSDDVTFSSNIDGEGGYVQAGSGTVTMTGTNSYTGASYVQKGTLQVDGNNSGATGDMTVAQAATLRGTGTIGGNVTVAGGTITGSDAGSSQMGTLTINGNLAINNASNGNGSNLVVRLGPNNASDLIKVGGAANIQNGTKLVADTEFGTNFGNSYDYRIMTGDKGITVDVNALNKNMVTTNRYLQATRRPDQTGTGDTLDLVLGHTGSASFAGGSGMSGNGNAVGHALDSSTGAIAQDAPYMDDSSGADTMSARAKAERQQTYNALSGEINASIHSALMQNSYYIREAVVNRLRDAECSGVTRGHNVGTKAEPHSFRLADSRCSNRLDMVWGQAYGGMGTNSGNSNTASLHDNIAGFIVGADREIYSSAWRVGALLGYDHEGFNVHQGRSSSGSSNDVTVGVYAGRSWDNLHLRLGADYTWNMISTNRRVNYNVYDGNSAIGRAYRQHGSSLSGTAQAYAELGYSFHFRHGGVIEPFGRLSYVNLHSGSSTETGGAAALHQYSQDVGVGLLTVGAHASAKFQMGKTVIEPYGTAAYRHGFGDLTPSAHESFADGGSGIMDIKGAPMSDDTALLDLGVRAWITDMVDIGVSYVGQYGNHTNETGVRANVRVRF